MTEWSGSPVRCERLGRSQRPGIARPAEVWRVGSADGSVIAKVLPVAGGEPLDWADHRREVLAYRTGMVRVFEPLLRAPRRHGLSRRADGSVVLWLEDIGPSDAEEWTVPCLAAVAQHLGTAQAALARRPLPSEPWLNRSALTAFVGIRGNEDELLAPASRPLPYRMPSDELVTATRLLLRVAPQLVAAAERLPRTVCHLDLHPGNILATGPEVVLVDWACVGIGPLGEDPANLVATAVLDLHLPAALLLTLFERVIDAYHQGLCAGGWSCDRAQVERAVRLTLVVKFTWVLPDLVRAMRRGESVLGGRPLTEVAAPWEAVARLVADAASALHDAGRTRP